MSAQEWNTLSSELFRPFAWHEFWYGTLFGAIAGSILTDIILHSCK